MADCSNRVTIMRYLIQRLNDFSLSEDDIANLLTQNPEEVRAECSNRVVIMGYLIQQLRGLALSKEEIESLLAE